MNGILLIDKPEGISSAEVVRRVKKRWRVKVGHLGTLDPFATGVLPLCLGAATRIAQFLNTAGKRYEGRIRLGEATDSGDRTGRVIRRADVPPVDDARLQDVARRFTGEISQVPPMYSALKRDGVPLYKLARQGVEVERKERTVTVHKLDLHVASTGELAFEVDCSKGTYVRVLAEDIGRALGSEAHLIALRRTRFGPFAIESAMQLERANGADPPTLVTVEHALAHLPGCRLDPVDVEHVRHGRTRFLERLALPAAADAAALLEPHGKVAAVLVRREGRWRIGCVLSPVPPLGKAPDTRG